MKSFLLDRMPMRSTLLLRAGLAVIFCLTMLSLVHFYTTTETLDEDFDASVALQTKPKVVISLSSFAGRVEHVQPTLDSLFAQEPIPADHVYLSIPTQVKRVKTDHDIQTRQDLPSFLLDYEHKVSPCMKYLISSCVVSIYSDIDRGRLRSSYKIIACTQTGARS
jgi:hypothetical protein